MELGWMVEPLTNGSPRITPPSTNSSCLAWINRECQVELGGRGDTWNYSSVGMTVFNSGREGSSKGWVDHRFEGGELLFEEKAH